MRTCVSISLVVVDTFFRSLVISLVNTFFRSLVNTVFLTEQSLSTIGEGSNTVSKATI